jgi:hypothetical protein
MSDEQENVGAGSENSGETASQETGTTDESTTASQETVEQTSTASAGDAAEPKAGDTCTCPDGRQGTLHDQEGQLVCLPNQG